VTASEVSQPDQGACRRYPKNAKWDHDHCAFCWAKFMVEDLPDVLHEGYCTLDEYHWICETCFRDFQASLEWQITTRSS
jgi:hypothetical protein